MTTNIKQCKECNIPQTEEIKFKGNYCRRCYNIRQKTIYYEKLKPLHQKYYLDIKADPEKLKKYNENHLIYNKKSQQKKKENRMTDLINISIQRIIQNEEALAEIERMNLLYP